jgi:hypothetical protein
VDGTLAITIHKNDTIMEDSEGFLLKATDYFLNVLTSNLEYDGVDNYCKIEIKEEK